MSYLEKMTNGYIEALFAYEHARTSTDPECDDPLSDDYTVDDLAPGVLDEIRSDVDQFYRSEREDLAGIAPGQAGYDFYLSRNGHGAGFFDRGLGEVGERLQAAAKIYNTFGLYVGDDGKIYGHS